MLFQFFDTSKKNINDLAFNHLILGRLLAFFDPELYLYLKEIAFLEEQFSANWILTLFSRKLTLI
jgi:Rab-GTPase-TBC domain